MNLKIMRKQRSLFWLSIFVLVSACGNHQARPIIQTLGEMAANLAGDAEPTSDIRSQLSAERISALQQPLILVSIPNRGASATMTVFAQNNGTDDWRTADNSSLVLKDDIVVATRGLGADLFAANPGELFQTVLSGAGEIQRENRALDGENREVIKRYQCEVKSVGRETIDLVARTPMTTKVNEICTRVGGNSPEFTNSYWVNSEKRQILQSRQWVSAQVGYVFIQHLKR